MQLGTIIFASRQHNAAGKWFTGILIVQTASIIFYADYLAASGLFKAYIFLGLYYAGTPLFVLLLYFFFKEIIWGKVIKVYPQKLKVLERRFDIFLSILVACDLISFGINAFENFYFTLDPLLLAEKSFSGQDAYFYKPVFSKFIFIHEALIAFILLLTSYMLIKKILKSKRFYRARYSEALFLELLYLTFQVMAMLYEGNKGVLDFAPLSMPLISFAYFMFFFYMFPREDLTKLIKYSADNIPHALFFFDSDNKCIYKNQKGKDLEAFLADSYAAQQDEAFQKEHFIENFYRAFYEENIKDEYPSFTALKEIEVFKNLPGHEEENSSLQAGATSFQTEVTPCQTKVASFQNEDISCQTAPASLQTEVTPCQTKAAPVLQKEIRTYEITWSKILNSSNKIVGNYIKFRDRTQELKNIEEEKRRAMHDKVTGLLNRRAFSAQASRMLNEFREEKFMILVSDIKDFKIYNTCYGSKMGDCLLQKVAALFQNESSKFSHSLAGRISGDKIALVIHKDDFNENYFVNEINKIQTSMSNSNYMLQIKLGIFEVNNADEEIHTMFDKACLAIKYTEDLYSKTVSHYDTELMEKIKYEKSIENGFASALQERQFLMYLQPQVDRKSGSVIGAEALVRWQHPSYGLMAPGAFVGILEKKGYIHQMDAFIWEEAVKKLAEWKLLKIPFHISVNVSAKDFHLLNVYKIFVKLVEKYGISASKLHIEITETVYINEIRTTTPLIIQRLRDYGFHVEIDDFGSGYSSLSMLKNLQADTLKIDMEFLRQTDNMERSKVILAKIIKMAKNLGMKVLNEGVETESQVEFLSQQGSDFFQGYYFSKPLPVKDFEEKYLYSQKAQEEN